MIWDRTSSGNQSRRQKSRPGVSAAALEILEARSLLSAVVVQLSASQDNTIYDMSAGDQSNGRGAFIVAGGDYGSVEARRGLLAFDIASATIPDGSTIIDVVLTMNLSQTMGGAAAVGVHRLLQTSGRMDQPAMPRGCFRVSTVSPGKRPAEIFAVHRPACRHTNWGPMNGRVLRWSMTCRIGWMNPPPILDGC